MNIFKEENKTPVKPSNSNKNLLLIGALVLMTTVYTISQNDVNHVEVADTVEPDQVVAVVGDNKNDESSNDASKMHNEGIGSLKNASDFDDVSIENSDDSLPKSQENTSTENVVTDVNGMESAVENDEIVVDVAGHFDGEHLDSSPEPWVADEVLAAEAKLYEMMPVADGEWSKPYGYGYDETFDDFRFHKGLDMKLPVDTIVSAPLAGVLSKVVDDPFYGKYIIIAHSDDLESRYYGIDPAENLQEGQEVLAGDMLGNVANSPVFEETVSPHLHFEISLNGKSVDPAKYINY